jgi:hypothetical protein
MRLGGDTFDLERILSNAARHAASSFASGGTWSIIASTLTRETGSRASLHIRKIAPAGAYRRSFCFCWEMPAVIVNILKVSGLSARLEPIPAKPQEVLRRHCP